ncbi:MAG: hypothetical protein NTV04_22445, partial [Deltaproteobacteria bacterium]|nr:hypothetical protein [Deltaproteobacteria bacterium]
GRLAEPPDIGQPGGLPLPSDLRALHGRGERRSPEQGRPAGRPYNRNHRFDVFLRDHHYLAQK